MTEILQAKELRESGKILKRHDTVQNPPLISTNRMSTHGLHYMTARRMKRTEPPHSFCKAVQCVMIAFRL